MKLSLSPRLKACCRYINPGDRIADVGCDHGYLSIYLLREGIIPSVLASDINEGPLEKARQNAARYHVDDKISFYLSDGLQQVPHDFDCMVCAGMGAETIVSILKRAPWLRSPSYRMVLQCQSRTHLLRRYLCDAGWFIEDESIIRDGHFLYTVMSVRWEPGHILTDGQCYISPPLLKYTGSDLREYYGRITEGLRQAVTGRGVNTPRDLVNAYNELNTDPSYADLRR